MSARATIVDGLVELFKTQLDGVNNPTNLYNNVTNKLKFWDEVNDFPFLCVVAGAESREYLPSRQKWGFLNISIKVYVKAEEPVEALENLLVDLEKVLDSNRNIPCYTSPPIDTTEILITSIVTDEGLLDPYGVGEVSLQVRYPVL